MLSIIIPAYNAEKIIRATLEDYVLHFSQEYDQDFEIVVVTNGCQDMTPNIVTEFCHEYPNIRQKTFDGRIGKGGAVIEGFKAASGDIVGFVDADNATRPPDLHKLIRQMGESDAAIGSRWLPDSNVVVKQPLSRRVASRGFNLLVRVFFGLPFADTQCGAKVFKRHAVDSVVNELRTPGFAFDIELLHKIKRRGYKIKEIAITWQDSERSTLNLKATAPTMFLALLRLRLLDSPAKPVIENHLVTSVYNRIWIGRKAKRKDEGALDSGTAMPTAFMARLKLRLLTSPARSVKQNRLVTSVCNHVGGRR